MSTDFIDMNSGREEPQPEPEAQAEPQNNPWEPWQQAGFDPEDVNPYDVRQAYDGWQALGNRDTRGYMLERMMQGNELPEGMSWQEAQEAIQQAWQSRQDPFLMDQQGMYDDPQQYNMDPQQQYAEPQQIDPYALREVWQQDTQRQLAQMREEIHREYEERQQQDEFNRGMEQLRSQYNLSESDMAFLAPRAVEYVQPGATMTQAIEQAYRDFDDWRRNALASMAQQQQQAPQTYAPQGMPASPEQPPRSLAEAAQFMEQQFGG